ARLVTECFVYRAGRAFISPSRAAIKLSEHFVITALRAAKVDRLVSKTMAKAIAEGADIRRQPPRFLPTR
ncbi:MAG TPA: hypothetical protein VKB53_01170, partial [Gammaproteobacteria bacterium]|nr:hypothetical protein [Gammaproteobacteria bacterium]